MAYVFCWVALSLAVGLLAGKRGRGSGNWFVIALILSPLIGAAFCLAIEDLSIKQPELDQELRVKCSSCAELVLAEATVCKHCGGVLTPQTALAKTTKERLQREKKMAEAVNAIKTVFALAAVMLFIYIWVARHGGGW